MNQRRLLVAGLLFVSGMCALLFQTAWLREFGLVFGASTPATAAVLAIFMGGLGLGNILLGKRADLAANPLAFYARLELFIALSAFVSPFLISLTRSLYVALGGQATLTIWGATIVRLLFAALVLGIPTILMGGTIPAAVRAVTSDEDRGRCNVGVLYGMNTLGAVTGTLLGTFFLLEAWGIRSTLWAACACNLAVALSALAISGQVFPSFLKVSTNAGTTASSPSATGPVESQELSSPAFPLRWNALAAGLAGFAFLLMELVWYRMLGPILGGSTFTFGLILAVALAGIGLGGLLYAVIFRDRTPTPMDLAQSAAWEAFFIVVPFALGDRLAVLAAVLRDLAYFGFPGHVAGWLIVTLLVVFPAAVVSGIQFPLLIGLAGQGRHDIGRQVGVVTACNTLGAMAGSLAGGFGLLPLLTAPGAWITVVWILASFAALILIVFFRRTSSRISLAMAAASILLPLLLLSAQGPTAVWRHSAIGAGRARLPDSSRNAFRQWKASKIRNLVHEIDGRESSIGIEAANGITFFVNGKSDGNAILDAPTQVMLGILPAMLHAHPRDSLVIGLGTGETAGWLAQVETVKRVDVVELEPAMRKVAQLCSLVNHEVLSNPKVRIIDNDAREAVLTLSQKYDLIVSEPSNPYRAGVSSLYTLEFYQAARARLQEDGLFVQWLQGYEVDATTVRTVFATLHEVFPHIEIWQPQCEDFLLICSMKERAYNLAELKSRIARPEFKSAMRFVWRTDDVEGLFAHYSAGANFVRRVARQEPIVINTDDRNVLEYGFARSVGRQGGCNSLAIWEQAAGMGEVRPPIAGAVSWELVEDHRTQMYAYSVGVIPPSSETTPEQRIRSEAFHHLLQGNNEAAIRTWQRQSRDFQTHLELAAFATAFADRNDPRTKRLIERLRQYQPLEAEIASAFLMIRRGERIEAIEALERVFQGLRTDPTPHQRLVNPTFELAVSAAGDDPALAKRLFRALGEPFVLLNLEETRVKTMCRLAQVAGPLETITCMEKLEPKVFWEYDFLVMRAKVYEATGHPFARRARQDLNLFLRDSDEVLLP